MRCRKCNQKMIEYGSIQVSGFEYNVIIFVCRNKECEYFGLLIGF